MKIVVIVIVLLCIAVACVSMGDMQQKISQSYLDKLIKKDDTLHNGIIGIYKKDGSRSIEIASGEAVSTESRFHIASVSKTFIAVLVAKLKEEGYLEFSDHVVTYLGEEYAKGLLIQDGTDYTSGITISQLMQHRSGLADFFEDKTEDGWSFLENGVSEGVDMSEDEILDYVRIKLSPAGKPGEVFHYSDLNYMLLIKIVEGITGRDITELCYEYFFKPLNMVNTSLFMESDPINSNSEPIIGTYFGEKNIIEDGISKVISNADGGLISTISDLQIFIHALFSEQIISGKTLVEMQQWVPEFPGSEYGFGMRQFYLPELDKSLPKYHLIGGTGATGSFMYYCPELELYYTGTLNSISAREKHIVAIVNLMFRAKL